MSGARAQPLGVSGDEGIHLHHARRSSHASPDWPGPGGVGSHSARPAGSASKATRVPREAPPPPVGGPVCRTPWSGSHGSGAGRLPLPAAATPAPRAAEIQLLRKLAAYPRQNELVAALREAGRIERPRP